MTVRNCVSIGLIAVLGIVSSSGAYADTSASSSESIQRALATLNRVVNHTQRLLDAKNYARLPHENNEFKEGVEALEKSIVAEPPAFKTQVEPLIGAAAANSDRLAAAAPGHDDSRLAAAHADLAKSVGTIMEAFRARLPPVPQQ